MPETPDTSSEAVERAAADLDYGLPGTPEETAAATLRALASERDAAVTEAAGWKEVYDRSTRLHAGACRDLIDALARAESAKADLDALLKVARAARAVAAWKEPIQMLAPELGGTLRAIYHLEAALDALSPELRAGLDHSGTDT